MGSTARVPRNVLLLLALLLAGLTLSYAVVWMRAARWRPSGMVGFASFTFIARENALLISAVTPGGPAALAGIRDGDRLVAVDGRAFTQMGVLSDGISNRPPGTLVSLTVERAGRAEPLELPVRLSAWPPTDESTAHRIASELMRSYPLFFFFVGFPVLFLRLRDRHAWILALLFAGIIGGGPLMENIGGVPPPLRGFALAFRFVFGAAGGALFYFFLAVFPARSPLDRAAPWLKWSLLAIQSSVGLPLAAASLVSGSTRPLYVVDEMFESGLSWLATPLTVAGFGAYGLGLLSLVLNTVWAPTAEVRRRTRVLLWGLALGPMPFLFVQLAARIRNVSFYEFPFWIWAPAVLFILVMPVSVAYAVLKHRVLDVPVLLRRSARYFLVQRGFTALLIVTGGAIVVLAASLFWRTTASDMDTTGPPPVTIVLGAAMAGVLAVWGLGRVHARVASRIDRAFFRGAYDARDILEDLITRSRGAKNREELFGLLQHRLCQALQPTSLTIYLRESDHLTVSGGFPEPAGAGLPPVLPAEDPLASALSRHARPWDTMDRSDEDLYRVAAELRPAAECLVPVSDRKGDLLAVLALGPRRSEEPYSGEDRRLLAGVAGQMGLGLESFALAEDIVRRVEAERRAAHEIEIARQVQSNLLPHRPPRLSALELAAHCLQARAVGGDFYDYLALGEGHLGLVLADISGKGMPAALLMSSLQATLRSRAAAIRLDPTATLKEINLRLVDSTGSAQFATMFLGDFDPVDRRLSYVNCGHDAPLLMRADGRLERLPATTTVLGAFPDWPCRCATVTLQPGDLLVLYSDGVTEARDAGGEMFGERRLADAVTACRQAPIDEILQAVLGAVTAHAGGAPEDDLTLLLARVRAESG